MYSRKSGDRLDIKPPVRIQRGNFAVSTDQKLAQKVRGIYKVGHSSVLLNNIPREASSWCSCPELHCVRSHPSPGK